MPQQPKISFQPRGRVLWFVVACLFAAAAIGQIDEPRAIFLALCSLLVALSGCCIQKLELQDRALELVTIFGRHKSEVVSFAMLKSPLARHGVPDYALIKLNRFPFWALPFLFAIAPSSKGVVLIPFFLRRTIEKSQ